MHTGGYFLSVLVGVSLGFFGSGGSILALPIMVYAFGISPVFASGYSLFVVGVASAVGSWKYFKKGFIEVPVAFLFATGGILGVFFSRAYLLPSMPDPLLTFGAFALEKNLFLILLFSITMIFASASMLKKRKKEAFCLSFSCDLENSLLLAIEGVLVGLFSGLVGAGGGFLVVPILFSYHQIDLKKAVGTSLLIIALNSLVGFSGELLHSSDLDWIFLMTFTSFTLLGIWIGAFFSHRFDSERIRPWFGVFIFLMGLAILLREIFQVV